MDVSDVEEFKQLEQKESKDSTHKDSKSSKSSLISKINSSSQPLQITNLLLRPEELDVVGSKRGVRIDFETEEDIFRESELWLGI